MLLAIINWDCKTWQSCKKQTMSSKSGKEIKAHWKKFSKGKKPRKQGGLPIFFNIASVSVFFFKPVWSFNLGSYISYYKEFQCPEYCPRPQAEGTLFPVQTDQGQKFFFLCTVLLWKQYLHWNVIKAMLHTHAFDINFAHKKIKILFDSVLDVYIWHWFTMKQRAWKVAKVRNFQAVHSWAPLQHVQSTQSDSKIWKSKPPCSWKKKLIQILHGKSIKNT